MSLAQPTNTEFLPEITDAQFYLVRKTSYIYHIQNTKEVKGGITEVAERAKKKKKRPNRIVVSVDKIAAPDGMGDEQADFI